MEGFSDSIRTSAMGRVALSVARSNLSSRIFGVLVAHYDESGTHDGSPVTVIAGLAGHVDGWALFENEWNKILKKNKISFLHAKDLFHRQKQHRGWTLQQMRECWADAMYVIQEQSKYFFISRIVLNNSEYLSFYKRSDIKTKARLDSKYGICFRVLTEEIPNMQKFLNIAGETSFVMEAGHKNTGDALRIFEEIRKSRTVKNKLNSLIFVGKEGNPGVQAADLLAYTIFNFINSELGQFEEMSAPMLLGETEKELLHSGLVVFPHNITPDRLAALRGDAIFKVKRERLRG